jgi:hypothetical protein
LGNLALACRACNLYKSDSIESLDPFTGRTVPLFQPRHDRWDHFRGSESGTLEGLSDVGRATVDCLKMNTTAQVTARHAWMRAGLYAG